MKKTRVRMVVELNLDPVPGFNHSLQDYTDCLQSNLQHLIPWYEPTVSPAELVEEQAD